MRAFRPNGIVEESKVMERASRNRKPKPKVKDPTDNALADLKLA